MLILPAIDLLKGNCVRLIRGQEDMQTIYSQNPMEMALHWESLGAKMLHIADLDGAFQGHPVNLPLVSKMRRLLKIPIQLGGGFRDMPSIQAAFDAGIDKIILGTVAVYNPDLVRLAVKIFQNFISVSIDASNEFVAVSGWKDISTIHYLELASRMRDYGVSELLFTDTQLDGTLSGPNLAGIQSFLSAAGVPCIVSGGISSVEDLVNLKTLEPEGLKGVILGKALYDQRITLAEALQVATQH